MVNLGLSRVDDAVAAKHPARAGVLDWRTRPPVSPSLPSRHQRDLRPADSHPEKVPLPDAVERPGSRGSVPIGELQPGHRSGAGGVLEHSP
ncbi:PREDICTED: transmembrane protein 141 isoform X5 [Chinchilla lanigera]|uniref:transmembrane protein 141 isoform X5 n=1 Tax=Chinchilla lanigera TaxID=34839 RepID=UPI0006963CCE|nr:PREDICTED: transmembrane protein 141 isoform X5 [Chinchilla lanigera]